MEENKDVLFSIALELDLVSLLKFCSSSKRINNLICKNDDVWRAKLRKEYPVVDVVALKNPRETYIKIVDAKVNSQKKFNLYLWNRDYEMRDILPRIYHVIWPVVGVYENEFMTTYTLLGEKIPLTPPYNDRHLKSMFDISFEIGLFTEDIPLFKKYRDDIIKLKELSLTDFAKKRDFTRINLIIDKLERNIPQLRQILTDEVRNYLANNNQIYKVGTPIASLYLV